MPARILISALGLAFLAAPAQGLGLTKSQFAEMENAGVDAVLVDAIDTCTLLVAGEDEGLNIVESRGWSIDRWFLGAPDPYFEDVGANLTTELGDVAVYAAGERYPGDINVIYCTYTVSSPSRDVGVDGLVAVFPDAMVSEKTEGSYASWSIEGADPIYGRAAITPDEFFVQLTLITH